ncbi:MAG: alpha/beta hydrolase [Actinomycetota bacterium]|nr:alpha/beta hydrolase [Actinomycetota bacterium]
MTTPRLDAVTRLSDGRRLAYAEYGDPAGVPVFVFHGLPGSRLSWGLLPEGSLPPAARIIAPDRPGYGGSDPHPGRTLLDWAGDVGQLADSLGTETFAIVGVSGGGPGALACAWSMPQRVTAVGLVASPAPTDAPGVFAGISATNRVFMKLAWYLPWLSNANTRLLAAALRRDPGRYLDSMKYKVHDVDRAILDRPEIHRMLVDDFTEAVRGGGSGMVDDMAANHGRPWGFPLDQITSAVLVWSCELDRSVPPAMGRYLSETIPSCRAHVIPGAGHLWVLLHLREVLDEVTRRPG